MITWFQARAASASGSVLKSASPMSPRIMSRPGSLCSCNKISIRVLTGSGCRGRLMNQLLNHAMIIHRAEVAEFDTTDLGALARQVLINAVPLSYDHEVDIAFDEPQERAMIRGDAITLREALSKGSS